MIISGQNGINRGEWLLGAPPKSSPEWLLGATENSKREWLLGDSANEAYLVRSSDPTKASGGPDAQRAKFTEDVYDWRRWLSTAGQRYQDARAATILASLPLMEAWSHAVYRGVTGLLYAYYKTGDWQSVLNSIKSALAAGKNLSVNITGLTDDQWQTLCANADLGFDPGNSGGLTYLHPGMWQSGTSVFPALILWKNPSPTRAYAGGYSAAWNVIYYGANPAAPIPSYANPNANDNTTILTNFGLSGYHMYLLGVEATKLLARLRNDCPDVPETQYYIEKFAPLLASQVTDTQWEQASSDTQKSIGFYRGAVNLNLLTEAAKAGKDSAAAQQGVLSSSLFWPLLIGAAVVGGYFILRRKKPSDGGAK